MDTQRADESSALHQTAILLNRARNGDAEARAALIQRFREPLERFFHSRLSTKARRLEDTQDATHEILIKALKAVDSFKDQGAGSFWAYLRTLAKYHLYRAAEEGTASRAGKPLADESFAHPAGHEPAPLDVVVGREQIESFERALEKLPEKDRNALLLRVEAGLSHAEIAAESGYPSPDAARMAITRALARVLQEMSRGKASE